MMTREKCGDHTLSRSTRSRSRRTHHSRFFIRAYDDATLGRADDVSWFVARRGVRSHRRARR